ncbi:MAG: PelD GGDEF domain-containing protein [Sideroxydans sp.]|nr:PelD GGDEF domain-containing protein [Sideroxydans sp.]
MSTPLEQQGRQYIAAVLKGSWMWLEVFVISLFAAAFGYFFQPQDPLWVNSEFPWVWLAAILIALRYGVVPGIASSLIILLIWFVFERAGADHFPKEYFLGGVLLVMLSGQFNIIWETRLMRARQINSYIDERLSQLTHQHHLLILAHQNLEQEFFSKPSTLRDALIRLNGMMNADQQGEIAEPALLKLLAQFCQLEVAAFFVPEGNVFKKTCEIGETSPLDKNDPLLRFAVNHKTLAHLNLQEMDEGDLYLSPFLIVSPIFGGKGELTGVLAVEKLPFFALTNETLQMVAVILEYYADSLKNLEHTRPLTARFPDISLAFAQQLSKMSNLQGRFNIESHLEIITLPRNDTSLLAAERMNSIRRALDVGWTVVRKDDVLIINLTPLSNKQTVAGYLARMESWFKEYFPTLSLNFRVIGLAEKAPLDELEKILLERPYV